MPMEKTTDKLRFSGASLKFKVVTLEGLFGSGWVWALIDVCTVRDAKRIMVTKRCADKA